eukprot:1000102-Prorocentrum_minimum.AAC.8
MPLSHLTGCSYNDITTMHSRIRLETLSRCYTPCGRIVRLSISIRTHRGGTGGTHHAVQIGGLGRAGHSLPLKDEPPSGATAAKLPASVGQIRPPSPGGGARGTVLP